MAQDLILRVDDTTAVSSLFIAMFCYSCSDRIRVRSLVCFFSTARLRWPALDQLVSCFRRNLRSGWRSLPRAFVVRFELYERSRATHVPEQINVRNL